MIGDRERLWIKVLLWYLLIWGSREAIAGEMFEDPFLGGRHFVKAEVDPQEVYVREPLVYTFYYYSTAALPSPQPPHYQPPAFDGFRVKTWPARPLRRERIEGTLYRVQEIPTTLFPQTPGEYRIGPATLQLPPLMPSDEPVVLRTRPLFLVVKPLPDVSRPPEFEGIVGRYELHVTADRSELQVGEGVTLRWTIEGIGDLDAIPPPRLPALNGVTVHPGVRHTEYFGLGPTPHGTRVIETILVPQRPGRLNIPSFIWDYFDPNDETYHRIETSGFEIVVHPRPPERKTLSPSAEGEPRAEERPQSQPGLRPIKPDTISLTNHARPLYRKGRFWLLQSLPLLMFLGCWFTGRSRTNHRRKALHRSSLQPFAATLERLASQDVDPAEGFEVLEKELRRVITQQAKISVVQSPLPSLNGKGIAPEMRERIGALLAKCERARFSPLPPDRAELQEALEDSERLLKALESDS